MLHRYMVRPKELIGTGGQGKGQGEQEEEQEEEEAPEPGSDQAVLQVCADMLSAKGLVRPVSPYTIRPSPT